MASKSDAKATASDKPIQQSSTSDQVDLSQSFDRLFVESKDTMAESKSRSAAPVLIRPGGRFGTFKVVLSETVTDGEMHQSVASRILHETVEEWGVSSSTDAQINEILQRIAIALRAGTSAERNYASVYITIDNQQHSMGVLAAKAISHYNGENAVRAWARSYRDGEMAERTYWLLKDPQNAEFRSEASADYGLSLEFVHLAFDYASTLTKVPGMNLTQMERVLMKACTANKTRTSRSAFIGGTDGGSVQQMSDAVAGGKHNSIGAVNATKTESSAPGFASRANFAAAR